MLYPCLMMNENNCIVLNWNVRGLNAVNRRQVVCQRHDQRSQSDSGVDVWLQETKLAVMNDNNISETLGTQFVGAYAALPATDTRGGVAHCLLT